MKSEKRKKFNSSTFFSCFRDFILIEKGSTTRWDAISALNGTSPDDKLLLTPHAFLILSRNRAVDAVKLTSAANCHANFFNSRKYKNEKIATIKLCNIFMMNMSLKPNLLQPTMISSRRRRVCQLMRVNSRQWNCCHLTCRSQDVSGCCRMKYKHESESEMCTTTVDASHDSFIGTGELSTYYCWI